MLIKNANHEYNFNFKILNNDILYSPDTLDKDQLYALIQDTTSKILPCVGILDSEGLNLTLGDIILYSLDYFKSYYSVDYSHEDGFILIPFNTDDIIWDNIDVLVHNSSNFRILGNKFVDKELYKSILQKLKNDNTN